MELTSSPEGESEGILAKILGKHDEPIDSFRSDCLRRDDHRCVVSGVLDSDMWITRGYPEGEESTFVESAHIIPYIYSNWANTKDVWLPSLPVLRLMPI
jgi:hypothetical protein